MLRTHDGRLGVALVQMIGDRLLLCEVFPGRTATEVGGFTPAVRTYER